MRDRIKSLNSVEDFKKVYAAFSGYPYYEKMPDEKAEGIYTEYKENEAYMYGAYKGDDCARVNSIRRGNTRRTTS